MWPSPTRICSIQGDSTRMHGAHPAAVDAMTTDMADTRDAGVMVEIRFQITWPVLAAGRDSNSPNSPGRQFPVMCPPQSRQINVVVCPTWTLLNVTIIGTFVSPMGLIWKTATLWLLAPANGWIIKWGTGKQMPSSSLGWVWPVHGGYAQVGPARQYDGVGRRCCC